jgi:proteasome activator subunit 4
MSYRFTLTDPEDPRYQAVLSYRTRFGDLIHRAAVALRHADAEDHIDAVIQICKGIDIYLLEYAITRSTYSATAKAYQARRE